MRGRLARLSFSAVSLSVLAANNVSSCIVLLVELAYAANVFIYSQSTSVSQRRSEEKMNSKNSK